MTPTPRRASCQLTAAPIAPSPTTITSPRMRTDPGSVGGGLDHHRGSVVAVEVVVDPREGLEPSADVVVQMRPVEGQRAPAAVHDVEHGAAALPRAVVVHDGAADPHVVVSAVEVDRTAATAATCAARGRVGSPADCLVVREHAVADIPLHADA